MGFEIRSSDRARKDLDRCGLDVAPRIVKKLRWFSEQAEPLRFAEPLKPPAIGDCRFRIGDYRAIGVVDTGRKKILILSIGHRKEVYWLP